MTTNATHMRQEVEEIPAATGRLLTESADSLRAAGLALRALQPPVVATIARGSSDHAASFLKYAIELVAGVPVASIGPSVKSVYGRDLKLRGCAAIAISQSGKSPDSLAMTQSARASGALTITITNTADSPLALAATHAIDLRAGTERSVAATKTFVSSVVAGLAILAHWSDDSALLTALSRLPEVLPAFVAADWSPLIGALKGQDSLFVIGRGPAYAIAQEAALKFKETCGLHAEAYSAAEVLHGPARIVEGGFPVLALAARDAAEPGLVEVVDQLTRQGATAFATTMLPTQAQTLPSLATGHALTDALGLIVSFYAFVETLSRARGFDPDRPPHLRKVTETV